MPALPFRLALNGGARIIVEVVTVSEEQCSENIRKRH